MGRVECLQPVPIPSTWEGLALADMSLLPFQKQGGAGLLSIMTSCAKLLHPSHLLPAVQLISRSQGFLSGLEQHPKPPDP